MANEVCKVGWQYLGYCIAFRSHSSSGIPNKGGNLARGAQGVADMHNPTRAQHDWSLPFSAASHVAAGLGSMSCVLESPISTLL
jgi:hypothetical protein